MEVTRENFTKAFNILEKELEIADFIAIDAEFTGLSTVKHRGTGYDSLEQLYTRTRVGSGQMLLIQYGISLFIWNEDNNSYEAMPFTFYIFPQPYKEFGNEIMYTSQSSSIQFLANNGFDFNKLFHHGISFMSSYEEQRAREGMEKNIESFIQQQQRLNSSKSLIDPSVSESKVFIPEDQREFIERVCDLVDNFMKDEECESVNLPPADSMQRKLIYEKVEEKYPLGLYLECVTTENKETFIRGHKTAASMVNKHQQERRECEERMIDKVVGFSNVMKLIVKSKKPIIGHNMLLDLFLSTTNFFGPPPYCLKDFKKLVNGLFPMIFDTKVIAKSSPINEIVHSTGLGKLVTNIENEQLPDPKVIISEKLSGEAEYKSIYHQAGYDAYCTGLVFISLAKYISYSLSQPSDRVDLFSPSLTQHMNHINIMGIRDAYYVDLCNDDYIGERKNVFYIRFPVSWNPSKIEETFSPYSFISYPINWINNESAFITISDERCYEDVFENLVLNSDGEQREYSVLPYSDYINNRDPQRRGNSQEDVPRKRKRVENAPEQEGSNDVSNVKHSIA